VAEAQFEKPRFCSRCGQPIVVAEASFCKSCGAPVTRFPLLRRDPGFSPILALVLSIIPGVGQIYRGKPLRGILWFFGVWFAYLIGGLSFGFLMHLICAANAAFSGALREDMLVR
jgi:TM2 domain-containing membrane protein YozV